MTTACAWCLATTEVDLVALGQRGLSHGICPDCMPRLVGEEAFSRWRKMGRLNCEKAQKVGTKVGTFATRGLVLPNGGLNA
jgi:hypothetical protein